MEKLYTAHKNKTWSGSDHKLLIAKFRLKLKKVGNTTRPFRCDLNQIPYDYTVEVINRFKGSDLGDRLPEELWTEVCYNVQGAVTKIIQKEKKKNARRQSGCLRWLYLAEKSREVKSKGEGKIYTQLNVKSQRIARKDK